MTRRDGHEVGVPCWVDTLQPDPGQAADFYSRLFGWSVGTHSADAGDAANYVVCRLRGRDVAGVGSPPSADVAARWNTYVRVDDVDSAVRRAERAGGRAVCAPFDSHDGGAMALLSDPTGATFGVWRQGTHGGAQVVDVAGAWVMSILITRDTDGAGRFYGALFGWRAEPFDAGGDERTMFRMPGYVGGMPDQPLPRDMVAVMASPDGEPGAPHWSVNFLVHDADAIAATASRLGGAVVVAPVDRPGYREAVVADPQGAVVRVSQLTTGA